MEFKTVWSRFSYSKFLIVTVLIVTFTLFLQPIAYVNAQRPGDYIVAEYESGILSTITPDGVRTVIYTFTGNPYPSGVAIDYAGNYIVTEETTHIICKITLGGSRTVIFTFAEDTAPWGVAIYPAIPAPVGGVATPVNKLEILAPYLALAGLIIAVSAVIIKKRK